MKKQQEATSSTIQLQVISYNSLKIGNLLGHGGYGDVYKATWHDTEVAIKALHLKTLSKTLQAEFVHESQLMAQCQFPQIVSLYGICQEAGHHALVMEYMPKGSLYAVLHDKQENLDWPLRWEIAIDIGKGLSYLHSKNILHRDLKSLNVLLSADYHAKISDFGLSKIKLESSSTSTQSKAGTVRWRAPETFKRGYQPALSMDVYSYGMILWEIAARTLPFADATDEITVMGWIKESEKEVIPTDCPKDYAVEIQQCWSTVENRPSAKTVLSNLTQAKPEPKLALLKKSTTPYVEKSWHFDPATARKVALTPHDGKPYQLLDATEKDKQKVNRFYQDCPVPGYGIGNVKVIHNRDFNQSFELQMKKLQQKANESAFAPNWPYENDAKWREETNKQLIEKSKPYVDNDDYPSVKLLPVWHGTRVEVLDSLFRIGYENLSKTDEGFFGKGLYGACEAEYAHRVYAKGALILNWVAIFSAYPVIDGDMPKLKGRGNYQNYDAHYVPVVPEDPNNPNEVNYFPCNPNQKKKYTEIVSFQSASCLPRYLVELQANMLKSIKLKSTPILQNQWPVNQAMTVSSQKLSVQLMTNSPQTQNSQQPQKILNNPPRFFVAKPLPPEYECKATWECSGFTKCVAVLPNGQIISGGGALKVWDSATGNCVATWQGHGSLVTCVAVLPNGQVVSGSLDNTLKVWDSATGNCVATWQGHSNFINCVAVLPNGQVVSGSLDNTLKVWDSATGNCVATWQGHSSIGCVAVLPNSWVISGGFELKVWDSATGNCVATWEEGHGSSVTCVAVLPNGQVISASYDNTLKVWDSATGNCVATWQGHSNFINCVAVLPNGLVLSGSWDNTLRVWDSATGNCVATWQGHSNFINCVAVLPNGQVISGSYDDTLKVWGDKNSLALEKKNITLNVSSQIMPIEPMTNSAQTQNSQQPQKILNNQPSFFVAKQLPPEYECKATWGSDWVKCIAVLPNGQVISSGIALKVWDSATGKCVATWQYDDLIDCVAVLPNGQVISGLNNGMLKVWDSATRKCVATWQGHSGSINCVAMLPNGQVISGSDDKTLRVWDSATGKYVATWQGHSGSINCVAMLPNGQVISGSNDGILNVWDSATGNCVATWQGHSRSVTCVAALSNGQVISGSWDKTLKVWDSATGNCVATWQGHSSSVTCVAALPNGQVVSVSDKTLKVWDSATGNCVATWQGHSSSVTCVAVLPNGQFITGSLDLKVWIDKNALVLEEKKDVSFIEELQKLKLKASDLITLKEQQLKEQQLKVKEAEEGIKVMTPLSQPVSSNPSTFFPPKKPLPPEYECKATWEGHSGWVNCVAVLPNGQVISGGSQDTFGSFDRALKVWDSATGNCVATWQGQSDFVHCVAVLPNGLIICGGSHRALKVWDSATGNCVATWQGHSDLVSCVAVLPNGQVISGGRALNVWDSATGNCVATWQGHSRSVTCVAALPNGQVISGSDDNTLNVWDSATGNCVATWQGHSTWVTCVAVLPNDQVISGSRDGILKVWDRATGNCVTTWQHGSLVHCVAVLPNGQVISGSIDGILKVWDSATGNCVATWQGHSHRISSIAVLPNGQIITGSWDRTLKVWVDKNALVLLALEKKDLTLNISSQIMPIEPLEEKKDFSFNNFSLSPTAKIEELQELKLKQQELKEQEIKLKEQQLKVKEAEEGLKVMTPLSQPVSSNPRTFFPPKKPLPPEYECKATWEGHSSSVNCVAMLPNGQVISGLNNGMLKVWDSATGNCVATWRHGHTVKCVAVLPNDQVISGSGKGILGVWDSATGNCVATWQGHGSLVTCVAVLPNGQVISGSLDETLKVWDSATGNCVAAWQHGSPVFCVAVLPNGQVVSGSNDKTLKVWDNATGKCVATWQGHSSCVNRVAVLPNGRVISGSNDGILKVWDSATGNCVATWQGHSERISSIAVLPNGLVISGGPFWRQPERLPIGALGFAQNYPPVCGELKVWDSTTGNCVTTWRGHSNAVSCVAVLPNGQVITGSEDRTLKVWVDKNALVMEEKKDFSFNGFSR